MERCKMSNNNVPSISKKSITSYQIFIDALLTTGFTPAGTSDGIFSLCDYFDDNIEAHTDSPDTDPWAWRMKSILSRDDILYGKIFFNKGGYLTKEWFPYFYALRRQGQSFEEIYSLGKISHVGKQIYELIENQPNISLSELKNMLAITKESKARFEQALTDLQMKLLITISGQTYKTGKDGQPYGWPVTTFVTIDKLICDERMPIFKDLVKEEAFDKIQSRIFALNPNASNKKIDKFIYG